jgi:hypothetical protein
MRIGCLHALTAELQWLNDHLDFLSRSCFWSIAKQNTSMSIPIAIKKRNIFARPL